jgi:hypothetical protein
MKVLMGLLGAASLLAGANGAFGDVPCQKCTHNLQVQYRKCIDSKRPQEICAQEEIEAAKICVAICNPQP